MSGQAGMGDQAPFILTLTLDPQAQARFDALRARHFPADRLFVGAHVTLFHALPRDVGLEVIQQAAVASDCFPEAGALPRARGGVRAGVCGPSRPA